MTLQELLDKLAMLKVLLESQDRDLNCVIVRDGGGRPIVDVDLKDSGDGCDNLDVYLSWVRS